MEERKGDLDYRKGAVPLYLQIKNILKKQILEHTYAPQSLIPSELELQKQYGVSRITARQAILELEQEGMVSRSRGKGTVVTFQKKIEEYLTSIKSFTDEMKERGLVPGTKKVDISLIPADAKLAGIFGCKLKDQLYCLKRIRTADGEAIVYFVSYFSFSRNLPLEQEYYKDSLYELLNRLGICSPCGVQEKFEAMSAGKELAAELEIKKGDPILKRTRFSYDRFGDILEYTVSYYRGDRYTYSIEIKNK